MKNNDFSPDLYFRELYKNRSFPFRDKSAEEIKITAAEIREKAAKAFGIDKIPYKVKNPSPVLLFSEKRKGYEIKTLSVEICQNLNMLCYLLLPEKKNGFGVVAVCGHGYGARQIIRQSKNGKYRKINFFDNYQKNFAEALVHRGNTVIVFEPIAFGKARLKMDSRKPFYISSCETVSMHSLMYGFTCAGLRIYQAMCCVDILAKEGLPRFGIMGISGGGLVSLYTALLDERIEKIVVSGYVNTFGTSVMARWHCTDNYIPGLLGIGDMYDFASALAPRPLLIECGKRDKLFPISGSEEAVKRISDVYKALGAEEKFTAHIHGGKHEISGQLSFDFFGRM